MSGATISARELHAKVLAGETIELIDVRTPAEFGEVHATLAKNSPLERLDASRIAQERRDSTQPLYVICRSGSRGKQACDKLVAAGCAHVVNVEGGTLAWEQAGLPVARGKKVMSLERQVRIAAGSLVLLGVGLSFVSPYFLGISAFVGAGLVFAGITDTCGMGMLLARMPWNQTTCASSAS